MRRGCISCKPDIASLPQFDRCPAGQGDWAGERWGCQQRGAVWLPIELQGHVMSAVCRRLLSVATRTLYRRVCGLWMQQQVEHVRPGNGRLSGEWLCEASSSLNRVATLQSCRQWSRTWRRVSWETRLLRPILDLHIYSVAALAREVL